jgi:hypothetical protein
LGYHSSRTKPTQQKRNHHKKVNQNSTTHLLHGLTNCTKTVVLSRSWWWWWRRRRRLLPPKGATTQLVADLIFLDAPRDTQSSCKKSKKSSSEIS